MKVVILAGGFGTRISEESAYKPKPMIEIGGMPILWHIMKTYAAYGFNEFVICAGNEPFMLTYGDAVGDINIAELVAFHKAHGKLGTMSMYNFGQNKGVVEVGANGVIDAFREKSDMDGDLINIGFMVFQPELFDLIEGDTTVFEKGPLTKLVEQHELVG